MEVTLKIRRSPDGASHSIETYTVDVPETATLLDALDAVKDKRDGTLAYRKSCRMAVCGSCGMRMDGGAVLACKMAMKPIVEAGHVPTISPMGNLPVIKDLVVDMEPFWAKIRSVKPFLQSEAHPAKESLVEPRVQQANIGKEALCIMCGCCVSECNSMESDPDFLGPAALAKAQRFVGDQREDDDRRRARLKDLNGAHGIWDCTRCYFCNQRCPKGVDPRDAIAKLGAQTFRFGSGSEFGAKTNMFAPVGTVVEPGVAHAQVFVDSTRRGGFLDETAARPEDDRPAGGGARRPVRTAARTGRQGAEPAAPHKAKNNDEVKRLWKLLEAQAREHEGLGTNHPSLIDSHD